MSDLNKRLETLEKNADPSQEQVFPDWLSFDEIDTMLEAMYERGSVEWDEIRSWKASAIERDDQETVKMMDAWFAKFQAAGLGNA